MMQEKTATLGKSVKIINSTVATFESFRSPESFSEIWQSVQLFTKENNISIDIPHQARG